ncbi:carbohydrate-binding family 9-like protein [Chitinophaga sp. 22321]|uniref:Carbohydrate-binding family 9-like protein n=1 Tax=Chitinophaga hostae TaxID=2831022 RepID=A0ABS5IUQ6_9BACT|nr:carbohydrate-binding family 9-like protein [Chitinophaga hostae]MBS0026072.1 carbohydrate-binding family 9-like protein [Chitinophaga hostae]
MRKRHNSIKGKIILIAIISLILGKTISAQTFSNAFLPFTGTPKHYVCYRATDSLAIDGKLDDAAWKNVSWSEDFEDIEGSAKPRPRLRTRVKMIWDDKYLYIAAQLEEPHIWATLRDHDAIIFHDNDFEVFIDPDGDTHQYYEIEINALNTVMDLYMGKPYRNGGEAMLNWDTKGIRTAVHINGTLNDVKNTDKEWTVEMAVPFSALSFFNNQLRPVNNSLWRINFSRVEWDTDIKNGEYVKQRKPENNWVWSPQQIINMHAPERWGYLLFTTQSKAIFQLPAAEDAKVYLWRIYYAQQAYRKNNGRYAGSLDALKLPATVTGANGQVYTITLEGISSQFTAGITGSNFAGSININQEGKVYNNRK